MTIIIIITAYLSHSNIFIATISSGVLLLGIELVVTVLAVALGLAPSATLEAWTILLLALILRAIAADACGIDEANSHLLEFICVV